MNDHRAVGEAADHPLEAFAAELPVAAYGVALRHGVGDSWLDLELNLWLVLTDTVKKWGRDLPRARGPGDARPTLSQGARPQ
jgi:hypothetical protein